MRQDFCNQNLGRTRKWHVKTMCTTTGKHTNNV
nr:MAG TPA: hypothetical protein [Caudoviricetes sp.]